MKSECVTSDQLYESMSSYQLKTKFWTKFGPKKAQKFFRVLISPVIICKMKKDGSVQV